MDHHKMAQTQERPDAMPFATEGRTGISTQHSPVLKDNFPGTGADEHTCLSLSLTYG